LGWPTQFCHHLDTDGAARISSYCLRMSDQKRAAVAALRGLNFGTIAVGDSYNDTSMLQEAHAAVFFRPPANVAAQPPQFAVASDYPELRVAIEEAARVVAAMQCRCRSCLEEFVWVDNRLTRHDQQGASQWRRQSDRSGEDGSPRWHWLSRSQDAAI
jgi:hypothetical protein